MKNKYNILIDGINQGTISIENFCDEEAILKKICKKNTHLKVLTQNWENLEFTDLNSKSDTIYIDEVVYNPVIKLEKVKNK